MTQGMAQTPPHLAFSRPASGPRPRPRSLACSRLFSKVQPHPGSASQKSQHLGPCRPTSWRTMFPFFPAELVRLSTLLHQELPFLFVPFGGRFGFLPLTSSEQRLGQIHPGNEWPEGWAHSHSVSRGRGVQTLTHSERVPLSGLHSPSDDLMGNVSVDANWS